MYKILLAAALLLTIAPATAQQVSGAGSIALFVSDLETMYRWYVDKLGFEIIKKDSLKGGQDPDAFQVRYALLKNNEFIIEMVQGNPNTLTRSKVKEWNPSAIAMDGFFKLGLEVKDLRKVMRSLQLNNVTFKDEIINNEVLSIQLFIVKDPEGNLIQFYQRRSKR